MVAGSKLLRTAMRLWRCLGAGGASAGPGHVGALGGPLRCEGGAAADLAIARPHLAQLPAHLGLRRGGHRGGRGVRGGMRWRVRSECGRAFNHRLWYGPARSIDPSWNRRVPSRGALIPRGPRFVTSEGGRMGGAGAHQAVVGSVVRARELHRLANLQVRRSVRRPPPRIPPPARRRRQRPFRAVQTAGWVGARGGGVGGGAHRIRTRGGVGSGGAGRGSPQDSHGRRDYSLTHHLLRFPGGQDALEGVPRAEHEGK